MYHLRLLVAALLLGLGVVPEAAGQAAYALTADLLQRGAVSLSEGWRHHPGDDPAWAAPGFDDRAWEPVSPALERDRMPAGGWTGVGWFRLHLDVAPGLAEAPFLLNLHTAGTATVYLDGRPLHNYGDAGPEGAVERGSPFKTFLFGPGRHHVLAVRYTMPVPERLHRAGTGAGFTLQVGPADSMVRHGLAELRSLARMQMFFTGLTLAFALLHLLLYLFTPAYRANLYYAVFLLLYAGNILFDYQVFLTDDMERSLVYLRVHRAINPFLLIFALRFIYAVFEVRPPRGYRILVAALLVAGAAAVVNPVEHFRYVLILTVPAVLEACRVILRAVRGEREGAWIIAAGFLVFFLFSAYDLLLDLNLIQPLRDLRNAYEFGTIGLFAAMSAYLARDFARTTERLLAQDRRAREIEMEHRLLEADVARKTKELEEARALQLAMLPGSLPALPTLRLAVHMQTATEVGGDYYDYHLAPDGTLTVAVGDATGHGSKAGIMVAVAKSLFKASRASLQEADFPRFFARCTEILKGMRLGNLFMALTLVRVQGDRLTAAAAGMPPLLLYRAGTGQLEEITLKGMPLGAFAGFPYRQVETRLAPGDTLLLLTDGFLELFDDRREMLDLPRARAAFLEAAAGTPDEIIAHLLRTARAWRGDRPPDDDMTFVVLQACAAATEADAPADGHPGEALRQAEVLQPGAQAGPDAYLAP